MYTGYQDKLKSYASLELQSRIDNASPYELIDMLLQGAKTRISSAIFCIERGQIKEKCDHISKAISILDGLRSSLDHDRGGEIATNLESLYDYAQRLLVQANLHNEIDKLEESHKLINTIHDAWIEMKRSS